MKIAVIGSGISGLSSAYFLSKKYKVDLYEKDDHFGGHSFTYEIKEGDKIVPVDLGFIVFNKEGEECFSFGKHKGKTVESVLENEPGYFGWLLNADFPMYTKKVLTAIRLRKLNT